MSREREISADLERVRQRLATPRLQLKRQRDDLVRACVEADEAAQAVTWWRAPSAREAAEMDAARAAFREEFGHLIAEEDRLKTALMEERRVAERIAVEKRKAAAKRAAKQKKGADLGQSSLF